MSNSLNTNNLDAILSGTDGNFRWDLHQDRIQAIKLKQTGLTEREAQFMMDAAASFDATYSFGDLENCYFKVCPTTRLAAFECAAKGLGALDADGDFTFSKLGMAWLAINCPELMFETMEMVPAYKVGLIPTL